MGPTPDSRPDRMPTGNSFAGRIARVFTQTQMPTTPVEAVTRRTIEVPGVPPVNVESSLGKALKPLLATGGEAKIDDEVSATGMGVDDLQRVADNYTGIFGINREAGTVFSPPVIEAQQKQNRHAA